jgi:UrcA family protein
VAAASAVCAPSLTCAADRIEIAHKTVNFAGLDLNSAEGASTLYGHLKGAARSVCAPLETSTIWLNGDYRTCLDDALGHGVHDVNRALLVQLYLADHPQAIAARYGIASTDQLARR